MIRERMMIQVMMLLMMIQGIEIVATAARAQRCVITRGAHPSGTIRAGFAACAMTMSSALLTCTNRIFVIASDGEIRKHTSFIGATMRHDVRDRYLVRVPFGLDAVVVQVRLMRPDVAVDGSSSRLW